LTPRLPATYRSQVLEHPWRTLLALAALFVVAAWYAPDFRLDASADSLLLENDQNLRVYREVAERYPTLDLLVVAVTPERDLFSADTLQRLGQLRDALRALDDVHAVTSVLDVPLLSSSDAPLARIVNDPPTIETHQVDLARAREEIRTSPIFSNLILSADGQTTALLIELAADEEFSAIATARNKLVTARATRGLNAGERVALADYQAAYDRAQLEFNLRRHRDIERFREVLADYRDLGVVHLGGVPMITDDMVSFVRNDLVVFGAGVFVFLVIVLVVIFGELRWVALPLLSCIYAGVVMIGMLGLVGWKVTVISSNFLALMLIITISMNIHLIVRYRQLRADHPDDDHLDLVAATTDKMARPCLYTALTTILGFGSLVLSGIKPVIDFGWMMSIGLGVAFLTSFLLFPSILVLVGKSPGAADQGREQWVTRHLANVTDAHGAKVMLVAAVLALVSAVGVSRLRVENSFINYFRPSTEIYQGLKLVDEKLGGTTPLQVLLDVHEEDPFAVDPEECQGEAAADNPDCDYYDPDAEPVDPASVWFTPYKVERIKRVHDFLAAQPGVGKVLSFASGVRVGEALHDGLEFDSLELALIYKRMPPEIRAKLIDPYVSIERDEARILLRVVDSKPDLRRKELLERIDRGLRTEVGLKPGEYTIAGLLVLYNNMLQSLFRSQILTLGVVMLGIAIMFMVLFRSVTLSVIGIVPNLLGALVVLGIMGWADIPLDMMTITIAAITIGIAVDNGIHYIYRFREEFALDGDYVRTLHLCHANIGRAVFYTSSTVIFGFSILVLSNFIPTIYFGVLTALAMLLALLAALTVLPKLILMWRPFGEGHGAPGPGDTRQP